MVRGLEMKRFAIIEDGIVSNIAKSKEPLGSNWIEAKEDAEIGGTYSISAGFGPKPRPDVEVLRYHASIPRAAFILAALDVGVLTETDAEQAVNGWPAGWDAFFDGQPARDRIAAKAEWASTATVRRNAPLIAQLAAFKGLTDAQVDGLFDITP